jgi:hypothetical protein
MAAGYCWLAIQARCLKWLADTIYPQLSGINKVFVALVGVSSSL